MTRTHSRLIASLAALALACGDVEDAEVIPGDTVATQPAGVAVPTGMALGVDTLGENAVYVTDANGRALYMLVDEIEDGLQCSGACLAVWPPLFAAGEQARGRGAPLEESLIGTRRRSDGAQQVTYGGHPLYYYAGDSGPGDTKGQDLTDEWGEWYLVHPGGDRLREHGDDDHDDRDDDDRRS